MDTGGRKEARADDGCYVNECVRAGMAERVGCRRCVFDDATVHGVELVGVSAADVAGRMDGRRRGQKAAMCGARHVGRCTNMKGRANGRDRGRDDTGEGRQREWGRGAVMGNACRVGRSMRELQALEGVVMP